MFLHVPMTDVTLWEKGLRPLGHSSSLFFGLLSRAALHRVRAARTHTSKHKQDACRMRTVIGALLLTGVAGLAPTQQHKKLKLVAAPLLPALLPSAVAAADSYEYGSA